MRVVSSNRLRDYFDLYPATRPSLLAWQARTKAGSWETIAEVLADFPMAKALNGERIRFKIKGNSYRLIVAYYFPTQTAYIKFIGSHAGYDKIDALTVEPKIGKANEIPDHKP